MNWVPWLLYAHILGAILAFGPTFAFPLLGAAAGREPQHSNFTLRALRVVTTRLVIPLAILQGVTGVGLILALGVDLLATRWLLVAIVLYGVALYIGIGVNLPNVNRMIELSSTPPGPGGPPPELLERVVRGRRFGLILSGLIVLIVFLMVVKPSF
ncbi:MAG: DUF2269 domain-containing protein [Chloroflexi bacterium]|nr:DUF2269 domain-containing protein [Chloroflexota bacterium]